MTALISETRLPKSVSAAWAGFSVEERALAVLLRDRIFAVAEETPGVGRLTEALRWRQAAYLTEESGAGTTLRIGRGKTGGVGLFVHCQSRVVADVRVVHDRGLTWDGSRGLILTPGAPLPEAALRAMILAALTYRL